ncbi:MAG: hypothetical protein ACI85K_001671 [Hyphomicrobiaceae bacterium]|jgi:hypothetical protein
MHDAFFARDVVVEKNVITSSGSLREALDRLPAASQRS